MSVLLTAHHGSDVPLTEHRQILVRMTDEHVSIEADEGESEEAVGEQSGEHKPDDLAGGSGEIFATFDDEIGAHRRIDECDAETRGAHVEDEAVADRSE